MSVMAVAAETHISIPVLSIVEGMKDSSHKPNCRAHTPGAGHWKRIRTKLVSRMPHNRGRGINHHRRRRRRRHPRVVAAFTAGL